MLEPALRVLGALLIGLGAMHLIFPRYFDWKRDLAGLRLINRQMMVIHTLFIGLLVSMMGLLMLTQARALIDTPLGHVVSGGLAFFWFVRLGVQWFGYSPALWRGKVFETLIHLVFSVLWLLLTAALAAAASGAVF